MVTALAVLAVMKRDGLDVQQAELYQSIKKLKP